MEMDDMKEALELFGAQNGIATKDQLKPMLNSLGK
jgi:hypothetical protein